MMPGRTAARPGSRAPGLSPYPRARKLGCLYNHAMRYYARSFRKFRHDFATLLPRSDSYGNACGGTSRSALVRSPEYQRPAPLWITLAPQSLTSVAAAGRGGDTVGTLGTSHGRGHYDYRSLGCSQSFIFGIHHLAALASCAAPNIPLDNWQVDPHSRTGPVTPTGRSGPALSSVSRLTRDDISDP
jgi:hypothetical protein